MSSFKEKYKLSDGESILLLGSPGTGKSYFAGSICEVVDPARVLLLCPKPREKMSALYRKHGLTEKAEVFSDIGGWDPESDKFGATAWSSLYKRVNALLQDDKYDAIIVDPFTDAVTLLEHALIAPFKAASPGDLQNTQAFYRQLADKACDFIQRLVALTDSKIAKSPKFVIVTMHTQPQKEAVALSGVNKGLTKPSADQQAEGIEYSGSVMPQMEGSYRRRMAGDFGLVLYTEVKNGGGKRMNAATKQMETVPTEFLVQARCSEERHAKMASIIADAVPDSIPNDFKTLLGYLQAGAA
jgi:hypothetical protein